MMTVLADASRMCHEVLEKEERCVCNNFRLVCMLTRSDMHRLDETVRNVMLGVHSHPCIQCETRRDNCNTI